LRDVLLIAVAGALGSVSRYGLSGWCYRALGDRFAWGTLVVNVLGSLVLGFIMEMTLAGDLVPRSLRPAVTIGFLGAFTTFSTFGYETLRFMEEGAYWAAGQNVLANLCLGLVAVWLGFVGARLFTGGV
jgi:fluoride exporter